MPVLVQHLKVHHACERNFFHRNIVSILKSNTLSFTSGLLQRLEEETSVNSYIAKQKLPREIEAREQEVAIMSAVLAEPAMGRSDLDALNAKVNLVND